MSKVPYYSITGVKILHDYLLSLHFADGSKGTFDFASLLSEELYAPLRNKGLFSQIKILCGGLSWTDEIDIAPEYLYEQAEIE